MVTLPSGLDYEIFRILSLITTSVSPVPGSSFKQVVKPPTWVHPAWSSVKR